MQGPSSGHSSRCASTTVAAWSMRCAHRGTRQPRRARAADRAVALDRLDPRRRAAGHRARRRDARADARGAASPPQGRPPVLLTLDRRAGAVVGIDFGHADVRVAVADLSRTVLAERVTRDRRRPRRHRRARRSPPSLVDEALEEADIDARPRARRRRWALSGPVDHDADLVHRSAILPCWGGIRPGAEMPRRLDVPVHIENDANLGALAEVTMGAARGVAERDLPDDRRRHRRRDHRRRPAAARRGRHRRRARPRARRRQRPDLPLRQPRLPGDARRRPGDRRAAAPQPTATT